VLLVAVVLAVWFLLILVALVLCRAAGQADDRLVRAAAANRRKRLERVGRRGVAIGAAAAAFVTLPPEQGAEAAACPGARTVPTAGTFDAAREALLCVIDRERRQRGRSGLDENRRLAVAARRHADDMADRNYFSHTSPGGDDMGDRIRRAGYPGGRAWRAGEVLAWGTSTRSTPEALVEAWLDSPGHRAILLSRAFAEIGAGLVPGTPDAAHPNGVTAAVEFGARK
jgi:uncharacterized protein YkwD